MYLAKVFFILIIFGSSMNTFGQQNLALLQSQLDELNRTFTYRNKPISPVAIRELTSKNDAFPVVVSIDIYGLYSSTQYPYLIKFAKDNNGNIRFNYQELSNYETDEKLEGYFAYKHLGKLKDGLHVLQTFSNGGGTEVIKTLLFVRCILTEGVPNLAGRSLVVNRVSEIELGPNYAGTIRILPEVNTIEIGADKFVLVKQVVKVGQ